MPGHVSQDLDLQPENKGAISEDTEESLKLSKDMAKLLGNYIFIVYSAQLFIL